RNAVAEGDLLLVLRRSGTSQDRLAEHDRKPAQQSPPRRHRHDFLLARGPCCPKLARKPHSVKGPKSRSQVEEPRRRPGAIPRAAFPSPRRYATLSANSVPACSAGNGIARGGVFRASNDIESGGHRTRT